MRDQPRIRDPDLAMFKPCACSKRQHVSMRGFISLSPDYSPTERIRRISKAAGEPHTAWLCGLPACTAKPDAAIRTGCLQAKDVGGFSGMAEKIWHIDLNAPIF